MAKKGKKAKSTGWYERQEAARSSALGAASTSKPRLFLTYSYLHADEAIVAALQQELSKFFQVAGPATMGKPDDIRKGQARIVDAIKSSDLLIAVLPGDTASTSVMAELAFAKASGKPVAIVSKKVPKLARTLGDRFFRSVNDLEDVLHKSGPSALISPT